MEQATKLLTGGPPHKSTESSQNNIHLPWSTCKAGWKTHAPEETNGKFSFLNLVSSIVKFFNWGSYFVWILFYQEKTVHFTRCPPVRKESNLVWISGPTFERDNVKRHLQVSLGVAGTDTVSSVESTLNIIQEGNTIKQICNAQVVEDAKLQNKIKPIIHSTQSSNRTKGPSAQVGRLGLGTILLFTVWPICFFDSGPWSPRADTLPLTQVCAIGHVSVLIPGD